MSAVSQKIRRIGTAIGVRAWARTRPPIGQLVYTNGGLGDELMLTAIAAAARQAGHPLHVLTDHPALWNRNSDPASVQTGIERWFYAHRRGWIATTIKHLPYTTGSGRHIAEQMAEQVGLSLPMRWRPVLRTPRRRPRDSHLIVLQNSCRGARYAATTKEWPQENWRDLVSRTLKKYRLIQLGTDRDPPLPGVEDRRGRTSLNQAAEILGEAALFVGLESGLQHVAAAMETPAVIIFGGRSLPQETGYSFNRNITRSPPCAGCALNVGCPNHMVCMEIPVEEVLEQIRAALGELR